MTLIAILARHGETDWNVAGRIQGHRGVGLNSNGWSQAELLAQQLRDRFQRVDAIISSDLLRAQQTAMVISQAFQIEARSDKSLRECSFGVLEGLTVPLVLERHGSHLSKYFGEQSYANDYDFRPYSGECREDVIVRQYTVLRKLYAHQPAKTIVIIGHGRSLNSLLGAYWTDLPLIKGNCAYQICTL